MLVKVKSIALNGIDTIEVDVEVNISQRGLPYFDIVGLPDKSVDESKHRVKTAFQNLDISFPDKRITVNLAPADIHKEGSFYDLPIATGILCAYFGVQLPPKSLVFGEVSLDGTIRHTKGALLLAIYAKEKGYKNVFLPCDCVREASAIKGINIYGVINIEHLLKHLSGVEEIKKNVSPYLCSKDQKDKFDIDFKDVIGQSQVKRALQICASGGHNIIMIGPPGAGKTMLAKALVSILPPLSNEEAIEVTKIYSSMGKIPPNGSLITRRPFRAPHHTTSYAGIIGGGSTPTPGEITLSHRGVLFMDEFSEFSRDVLESLRQPMEEGSVIISRSRSSAKFPARFILVASSNPCPCGFFGHPTKKCGCTPKRISNYQKKLSGPIMDRIDLHVNVLPVDRDLLYLRDGKNTDTLASIQVSKKVAKARKIQNKRFERTHIFYNSEMNNSLVKRHCSIEKDGSRLLNKAVSKYNLSTRAYFKILKVARTIADLEGFKNIQNSHLAEAIAYRTRIS